MSIGFDLHMHSTKSDGTCTPRELVQKAARRGIPIIALTDHDTTAGVDEALEEASRVGIALLPAIEMDVEWPTEMHILGVDIEPGDAALQRALSSLHEARNRRNERILQKLAAIGCDVRPYMPKTDGIVSRLHIALALCSAGFASGKNDAFTRYLVNGAPAYCTEQRLTPKEAIMLIKQACGIPILAHPCKMQGDVHTIVRKLADWGIMGLEAYYPASSAGMTELFESLAQQYHLLVTSGSDYHGTNRKGVRLGCAWQDTQSLMRTAQIMQERLQNRGGFHVNLQDSVI